MALSPGARLGAHEIVGLLGAGGMGEVYLAHDTKLNRRVAIKVLPEAYASDPDRVARFHREAQAVAALNHAGIAAIYELAEADGTKFLVLELIEGETLANRLQRGPLAIDDALQIAKQILEALEAAHERGVCHRDLKPANIKLTPDGSVKVLDFGLAKFLQNAPSSPHLTHSPTLSLAGTYPGVILGTAGYMSPEQAKGFEADQRSDIFSFGCILYELLAGRKAFEGETASEILASVLKSDVEWSALPPRLNPRLSELLKRCLEKNPKKRWHAAADVRVELESIIARGAILEEDRERASLPYPPMWKRLAWASVFFMAGLLAAGVVAWLYRPATTTPITRFVVSLPEKQQYSNTGRQVLALSPDGANLVYVANRRLFIRPMSGLDAREIAGSDSPIGPINPVFSPDGQWIAYRTVEDNALKRIPISGGAAVVICPSDQIFGMSWHEDAIVFGQGSKGIMRVSPSGGVPEVIAAVENDEIADAPQLLPRNRGLLFSIRRASDTWEQGRIVVQPLDGGARKTLIEGAGDGRYLPTGHLMYATGGVVMAVPFDLDTTTVRGARVPMVVGVQRTVFGSGPGAAFFVVSSSGTAAYMPGPSTPSERTTNLGLFDRNGDLQRLNLPPGPYAAPRVSRDGRWVAFESADPRGSFVSVFELNGGSAPRRLTFEGNSRAPIWSPDGQWIAYQISGSQAGQSQVFVAPFPWSGSKYQLPMRTAMFPFWSAKGDQLITTTRLSESHATAVVTKPRFAFGQPTPVPRYGRLEGNPFLGRRNSEMMPDGEHVIGVVNPILAGQYASAGIVVVLNWFDELRQRVPRP